MTIRSEMIRAIDIYNESKWKWRGISFQEKQAESVFSFLVVFLVF